MRVLTADADPAGRATLRRLLGDCRFAEAETAAGAVAAVLGDPPDVLILGNVPDAGPAEVLERLAAACPTVFVIAESGGAGEALGVRLLRLGGGDYLSKSELLGDDGRAEALLARAVLRAREVFRLARRAAVYRANTLVKRRLGREAAARAGAAADAAQVARRDAESARERLSLAVSAADLGTWDWFPESGRVVHDDRLLTMLGYAAGEVAWSYSFWRDALHPDDRGETLRALGEHLEDRSDHFRAEGRLRTKAGGWTWTAFTGKVVARDELGRPSRVAGTHQDVDSRKRAELAAGEARDAAERTRRRLGDILSSIRDAFVVLDAAWRFTHVNPQAQSLLGRPAADLLGHSIYAVFPGLRGGPFETAMNRAMSGQTNDREPATLVAQFKPVDKWFDARFYAGGEGGGISIFFLDVSELKRQQRQAHDSEALARGRLRQLDSIYQTAPAGLAFVDRQLRYVSANDRLAAIHGARAGELIGRPVRDVVDPAMFERVRPIYGRVLAEATPQRVEVTAPPPPGTGGDRAPRTYLTEYMPVVDADGRVEGINVVATDITDRKRAELQLQAAVRNADDARVSAERAKEIAERASSAKSEFLAVLSHELRTPLTPVLAGVQLLQQNLADAAAKSEPAETLAMIRRNVELEVRLIDDLLDLTRLTRGKTVLDKRRVDVNAAVRHVVEICRGEMEEKGLTLDLDLSDGEAAVVADAARLQQVLWNLLKNAVKFTPPGGRVAVRTSRRARDEQTASEQTNGGGGGGTVVCEVSDTGVGIDADVLPKVFTAFEQGGKRITRTFGGLGLGLAISRALVAAHGGTLRAQSDGPGRGATFTLVLPAPQPAPPDARPSPDAGGSPPAPDAAEPARPHRVLLVEDHADTCRLMARFLRRRLKLHVATAGCVEDGLRLFRDGEADGGGSAAGFDLIISDIGLPDGNGTDLLRRVAALGRDVPPAVALSGYGTERDVRNSHDAGFREHLTKPVDLERLEAVVRSLLK